MMAKPQISLFDPGAKTVPRQPTLREVEADYINKVISETRNLAEAARVLDIDPSTLWRKFRRKVRTVTRLWEDEAIAHEHHLWALQRLQMERLEAENDMLWLMAKQQGVKLPEGME